MSAPIDRLVVAGLCSRTAAVDLNGYRAAHPEEREVHRIQPLRTIAEGDWQFEATQGLWSWIRVLRPQDATVEEVARLLYGEETASGWIVPALPFFGFDPQKLRGSMLARWEDLAGRDEDDTLLRVLKDVPKAKPGQRETTLQHGYDPSRSPEEELLHGAQADEIALLQAQGLRPTGATRDELVSRIQLSLKLVEHAAGDAARFHLNFELVRTRMQNRLQALKALVNPRLARKWDAQSARQLEILQRATSGLRIAATYLQAIQHQGEASDTQEQTAGAADAMAPFITPITDLAKAYVEAAQLSDLAVSAGQIVAQADEQAKRLPFDFAEARLRGMRRTLAHAEIDKLHPEQRYSQSALEANGVAGMSLHGLEGCPLIQSVVPIEQETPTFNLSVEPHPNYFVGPSFLVHNAAEFHLGNFIVYEGYNEQFPDLIYIGQTNDLKARERAHQAEGRDGLKRKFLTDQEVLFFKFKSGMKLRPRLTGLDELTADYFEQVNKDWEEDVRGDDKVMNRIEIVAEKNWPEVVRKVTELYCPK